MPRFNVQRARAGNMTDEEIVQFLDTERAEGREYEVDPAEYPALRTARAKMMSAEEPEVENPAFYADPVEMASMLVNPSSIARHAGSGLGGLIAGHTPLARAPVDIGAGVARMGGAVANKFRGAPMETVEQGAELLGGPKGWLAARVSQALRGMRGGPRPQLPPGATAVPAGPMLGNEAVTQTAAPVFQGAAQEAAPALQAAAQPLAERGGTSIARMSSEELAAFRAANPGKTIVQPHVRELPKPKPRPKPKLVEQHPNVSKRIAESNKAVSKKKPEMPESWKTKPKAESRHDVQYYSESKGTHVNIEDMNQKHLEQAYRKLASTNPKPGSVAQKVLDAMLEEAKHRYKTGGIHIGQ